MEGYLNKIFTYLIAVVIFFVFPVYLTYEKKDDISHAIVSKATHLFVDNVRSKGYISPQMYQDYTNLISATGNRYEIKYIHTKKRYDPVVYFYSPVVIGDGSREIRKTAEMSYEEYEPLKNNPTITVNGKTYSNVQTATINGTAYTYPGWKKATKVSYETFSNDMIDRKLNPVFLNNIPNGDVLTNDSDLRKYKMSVGDNFQISIRNTNTTIASILFYSVTSKKSNIGAPRIYIKYGGVVRNEVINTLVTQAYAEGEEEIEIEGNNEKVLNTYNPEVQKEYNFACINKEEKITLEPGTYQVTAYGAQGGGSTAEGINGGLGGKVDAVIEINKTTVFHINVGGKGVDAINKYSTKQTDASKDTIKQTGGYNGGGNSSGIAGAGGGGCTELRTEDGKIMLIAAGGGGNTAGNTETYKNRSAGGREDGLYTNSSKGESGCILRHIQNYENDEAGGGAGYLGGQVVHGDNTRCSYGGKNYIYKDMFMSYSTSAGVNKGNGSLKIRRIN